MGRFKFSVRDNKVPGLGTIKIKQLWVTQHQGSPSPGIQGFAESERNQAEKGDVRKLSKGG